MSTSTGRVQETVRVYCRLRPRVKEDFSSEQPQPEPEGDREGFLTELGVSDELGQCCLEGWDQKGNFVYRKLGPGGIGGNSKAYSFTGFLPPEATQTETYDMVGSGIVDGVLEGFNGTILAYGQTGSGKTYTMMGGESSVNGDGVGVSKGGQGKERGVIPRAFDHLFSGLNQKKEEASKGQYEYSVSVSYLQIYCELLQDLLCPSTTSTSSSLLIRQRSNGQVYVEGLSAIPVASAEAALKVLSAGDVHRATAATVLNAHSSRSHAAVIVTVDQHCGGEEGVAPTVTRSMLFLMDLAGSERVKRLGGGGVHQRFEELKAINLSLSALGNCVSALAQGRPHVPFRDSKLTRLLQQSLGGNARTALIVAAPPGPDTAGETAGALLFAQRALKVQVSAVINVRVDLEDVCAALQRQLDAKGDECSQLSIAGTKLQTSYEELKAKVAASESEILALKAQLGAASQGFSASLDALKDAAMDPSGERAVAAVEAVNLRWRQELETLQETHAKQIVSLRRDSEARVSAYQAAASSASSEWSSCEYELTKEREGHLETLRELRMAHEQIRIQDKESSSRIVELLSEASEVRDKADQLSKALEEARASAEVGQQKVSDLTERLIALERSREEEERRKQTGIENGEYVSREQIQVMEGLFKDTVDRLCARVAQLEGAGATANNSRGSQGGGGGSAVGIHNGPVWQGAPSRQRGLR